MIRLFLLLLCTFYFSATLSAAEFSIKEFTSIKVKHQISKKLEQQFPNIDAKNFSISLKNFDDIKKHSRNSKSFSINYDRANSFLGNVLLDLYFIDDKGEPSKRYRLHAESNIYISAYKLNKRLKRNAIVKESDIELAKVRVNSMNHDYFLDKTAILGMQTKKIVYKDTFLSNTWIESIPDIKKGEIVPIKIRKKSYEIDGHAEALENGYIGEKIRIKLNMSKKIIWAKIIDGDNVKNDTQKIIILAN